MIIDSHPVLSCEAAKELEAAFFSQGTTSEGAMMYRAGRAVAAAIEDDFEEIGGFPANGKAVFLAGKGHNAGDALICANTLLDRHPDLEVLVLLGFPPDEFRQNVVPPFELLKARSEVRFVSAEDDLQEVLGDFAGNRCIDLCVDGIFGMQCKPPLRGIPLQMITAINRFGSIRFRAAIDLPSGIGTESDENAFAADFTYATGIMKTPVIEEQFISKVGRLRYLDLGFFGNEKNTEQPLQVLRASGLWQLASLRKPNTHKRTFGHLLILAGSRSMPGACLMAATSAVSSGCGLVTVGTVNSVTNAGTINLPEAMWTAAPGKDDHLDPQILEELAPRMHDFAAILIGPGLGQTDAVRELIREIVQTIDKPIIVDASGLIPELRQFLKSRPKHFPPVVLTPHMGEWKRIGGADFDDSGSSALTTFCSEHRCIVALKGARTKIADDSRIYLSPFGGPVLARGGTGDLLAGMIGSMVAQDPANPISQTILATIWHGRAADCMARSRGDWAVRTTEMVNYLPEALGFKV